jgi:hypothetical protein
MCRDEPQGLPNNFDVPLPPPPYFILFFREEIASPFGVAAWDGAPAQGGVIFAPGDVPQLHGEPGAQSLEGGHETSPEEHGDS